MLLWGIYNEKLMRRRHQRSRSCHNGEEENINEKKNGRNAKGVAEMRRNSL